MHHFYPQKIVEAFERRLEELSGRCQRVVVVYGDCGTAGALDPVLQRYGAVQLRGPHCYEMFAGKDFDRLAHEQPATFFLTDWLVRNFERAVIHGLGLDRYPDLKSGYVANYSQLLHLAQIAHDETGTRAREIEPD